MHKQSHALRAAAGTGFAEFEFMVEDEFLVGSGRGIWIGGSLSGLIAGVVMAGLPMLQSIGTGAGFWYPMRLVGAMWYGMSAFGGGSGAVVLGIITHFIVSALLGVTFAALIRMRTSTQAALFGGIVYGMVAWFFMTYVGLSIFNPIMRDRTVMTHPDWWFFYHLVYGGALLFTPSLRRAFTWSREPSRYRAAA